MAEDTNAVNAILDASYLADDYDYKEHKKELDKVIENDIDRIYRLVDK